LRRKFFFRNYDNNNNSNNNNNNNNNDNNKLNIVVNAYNPYGMKQDDPYALLASLGSDIRSLTPSPPFALTPIPSPALVRAASTHTHTHTHTHTNNNTHTHTHTPARGGPALSLLNALHVPMHGIDVQPYIAQFKAQLDTIINSTVQALRMQCVLCVCVFFCGRLFLYLKY